MEAFPSGAAAGEEENSPVQQVAMTVPRRERCANGAAAFASVALPAPKRAVNLTAGGGIFSGEPGSGRRLVDDADRPARGIERQMLGGGGAAARGDPVPAEKLDEWVQESVLEVGAPP